MTMLQYYNSATACLCTSLWNYNYNGYLKGANEVMLHVSYYAQSYAGIICQDLHEWAYKTVLWQRRASISSSEALFSVCYGKLLVRIVFDCINFIIIQCSDVSILRDLLQTKV